MSYLSSHYDVLNIDTALKRAADGRLGRPTACITFDDGYANNYTDAFPILKRFGHPATIYLASGLIGTSRSLWTTELLSVFEASVSQYVELAAFDLPRARLTTLDEARQICGRITTTLKGVSPAERKNRLEEFYVNIPEEKKHIDEMFQFMNWSQVIEMGCSGLISFGAHTVNHEIVSNLDDLELSTEIGESVSAVHAALKDVAPQSISETFAYPNGEARDFDVRAKRSLASAGCVAAVTTIEGTVGANADPFEIPRVLVGGDMELDDFAARTSGALSLWKGLRL